ncbi:MAG: TraR/DksA family transcriptional regulator [Ignavibacteria bacterium]
MAAKKVKKNKTKSRTSKRIKSKGKKSLYRKKSSVYKKKSAGKKLKKRLNKTHLSAKELNHFKRLIIEQKNEILENARRLRESLVDENTGEYVGENSTFSTHMAEHGTDEMEREKAFMFIQRDEKHLYYLENALERIKKKTYGLCVSCGKPIDRGRLEAVPITQHCIKCKINLSNSN